MGITPKEDKGSKEAVKSFIQGSSSGYLFTFGQLHGFFFHTWLTLGPSPTCMCNSFSKYIPAQWPIGWPWHHIWWSDKLLLLIPKGAFLCLCNVSLAPRMGNIRSLDLLHKQGLAPFCFWLLLSSTVLRRQSLAIYSISFGISILKCKQETGCKYLTWAHQSPVSRNANRRLIVNVWTGDHLFLPQEMYTGGQFKCLAWSPSYNNSSTGNSKKIGSNPNVLQQVTR